MTGPMGPYPPRRAAPRRDWQDSARGLIEAAILASLLWAVKALVDTQTQLAVLQENVLALRTQMADVPSMQQRIGKTEVQVDNLVQAVHDLQEQRR